MANLLLEQGPVAGTHEPQVHSAMVGMPPNFVARRVPNLSMGFVERLKTGIP
jgi:hypothetical protein